MTLVDRHRTAMSRVDLSRPISTAIQDGVIEDGFTIFDYGCGRGDDINRLAQLGFTAKGWDPNHHPDQAKCPSDIVNLGYVINVIENPTERRNVLQDAWKLAKQVLVVAARPTWESRGLKGKPYGDGVLTTMNSFQKFYEQDELREYIENTLKHAAMAAAPGIFYVFRDASHAQRVLANRARTLSTGGATRPSELLYEINREKLKVLEEFVTRERRLPCLGELPDEIENALLNNLGSVRASFALIKKATGSSSWSDVDLGRSSSVERKFEQNRHLLEPIADFVETRGRLPMEGELDDLEAINEKFNSVRAAFSLIRKVTGSERWKRFEEQAKRNFLVYLALASFSGQPRFKDLPEDLKHDVRELFGTYEKALEASESLLFAVGNRSAIAVAAKAATIGKLTQEALYVHKDFLGLLPPLLRIYEGCGRLLTGTVGDTTIVKLHFEKSQISYLHYPSFEEDPHPELSSVVVCNLQGQKLQFRDFRGSENPPILHRKELFVPDTYPNWEMFRSLSDCEEALGLLSSNRIGTREAWKLILRESGLTIQGHRIVSHQVTSETAMSIQI
jgi:SAM-dependent methyltransferase